MTWYNRVLPNPAYKVAICDNSVVDMRGEAPDFLKIHKVGCSGIGKALYNEDPRGRTTTKASWAANYYGLRPLVCMFRNPAERLESAFQYMSMPERLDYVSRARMPPVSKGFEYFVLRLCIDGLDHLGLTDPHVRPQYCFVHDRDLRYLPTLEVPWDWARLSEIYNRPFPPVNTSTKLELSWTQEMIDAHRAAFAWDWGNWERIAAKSSEGFPETGYKLPTRI